MRLLTAVFVLLAASSHVIAQTTETTVDATTATTPGGAASTKGASDATTATTLGGAASTTGGTVATGPTQSPGTGSTSVPVSTITGGSNTGSTAGAQTTTPTPMKLSTFPVSNGDEPLDAKLILQHAVQLDQQINALNNYLVHAQADTNSTNSPLFAQLKNLTGTLNNQTNTLQGLLSQLQTLTTSQNTLDTRVNNATNTFVCFSQSSCVTDVPTTAEPTSPGPTPSVTPCSATPLTAELNVPQSYTFNRTQNVAPCSINVTASNLGNNVSITINVTLSGPNSYVTLVEKRTQQNVTLNVTSNHTFNAFQEVDVYYYACPQSTVQFSFDYVEVNNCLLNCTGTNGKCKVSTSGQQYCECTPCLFTGTLCETPYDPCQAKQKRLCGETAKTGQCYRNLCFDQCYACACSPNAVLHDTEQKCDTTVTPEPFTTPATYTCQTTVAPTTTTALLTSPTVPSGSSPATAPSGSPAVTATSPAGAGSPSPASQSTVGGSSSTEAGTITTPAASSSTTS